MNRTVFVPGLPASQGSKKAVLHKTSGRVVMMESSKLRPWRDSVMAAVRAEGWHHEPLIVGPVQLQLLFVLPRPKHHYRTGRFAHELKSNAPHWHSGVPDASKLQRAVEDALVQAGALRDDAQISVWSGAKEYGSTPGVRITLLPIDSDAQADVGVPA